MVTFDLTKPASGSRFNSEEIRDNFTAVSRANDLRPEANNPPNLTIFVNAGRYSTSAETTNLFAGGDSPTIDTVTGGAPDQERVFAIELDNSGVLFINNGAPWAAAGTAMAPNFTSSRIPIALITVSFNDTAIEESQIADVRPLVNLGVSGGGIIDPGLVLITATDVLGGGMGQTSFDTSSSFTFFPNENEVLVWVEGLFQCFGVDYTEPDDSTILFTSPVTPGDKVAIWKVGTSASPGSIGLADLSDVDGDQAAGFQAADSPTGVNPFLTASGHASVDHLVDVPSLAPVAAHLVTIAISARHHASEIEADDNFTYSNATDVQAVLDDIESNIYQEFLDQHTVSGEHGPSVTIETTTDARSLFITHNTGAPDSVPVLQVIKSAGGTADVINLQNSGGGRALRVVQDGDDTCVHITHNTTAITDALLIETTSTVSGSGPNALRVIHARPDSDAVFTSAPNFGFDSNISGGSGTGWGYRALISTPTARGILVSMDAVSTQSGLLVQHNGNPSASNGAVRIDVTDSSASNPVAILVNQSGDGAGLRINKPINGPEPGIKIQTNATGTPSDIEGTNDNWSVLPTGTGQFANVVCGGGSGATTGFLVLDLGATLTVNGTGGVTPTRSFHKVDTSGGAPSDNLETIETSGIADGTILVLQSVDASRNVVIKDNIGNIRLSGDLTLGDPTDKITLIKSGSQWHALSEANN